MRCSSSLSHLCDPSLDSLQYVQIFPVQRSPEVPHWFEKTWSACPVAPEKFPALQNTQVSDIAYRQNKWNKRCVRRSRNSLALAEASPCSSNPLLKYKITFGRFIDLTHSLLFIYFFLLIEIMLHFLSFTLRVCCPGAYWCYGGLWFLNWNIHFSKRILVWWLFSSLICCRTLKNYGSVFIKPNLKGRMNHGYIIE